jgi:glycosyltransferase involved in cell wall biosynthesis
MYSPADFPHSERRLDTLDQGVHVTRLNRNGIPVVRFWNNQRRFRRALAELHRQDPIDIIEGGEADLAALGRDSPAVKVLRMHGGFQFFSNQVPPSRWGLARERSSFRIADHLCAVSNYVGETTRRLLGLGSRPIEVILNPVDIELFQPTPVEQEVPGRIVFAGTLTEKKGIRQLVEAFVSIAHAAPEAHLVVCGGELLNHVGTPFQNRLQALIPASLSERVQWRGRVPRSALPDILRQASIAVYPSHMEALPIAWLEGLASGKAVLASNTGPGPEVIEDGVDGLLCNPHDKDSIASQLLRLLQDPDLRRRLGLAARAMVERRFRLESIVDQNISYYQRLISKPLY